MEEKCKLIGEARKNAEGKGLNLREIVCPFTQACLGLECLLLKESSRQDQETMEELGTNRVNNFFDRVAITAAIQQAANNKQFYRKLQKLIE